MKVLVIPFGMRCNAAMVANAIVNQPRLPFDWTQMSPESMLEVLQLSRESTQSFWESYFSEIDTTNHNKRTGSWLPHDTFVTEEERKATVDKYVRRTTRLQEALAREEHKVFLVFFGFPVADTLDTTRKLISGIRYSCKENYSIIICNAVYQEYRDDFLYFIYEPLLQTESDDENKDWNDLTKRVENRIRVLLEDKVWEPVPIL
jgi:hypothetical protein